MRKDSFRGRELEEKRLIASQFKYALEGDRIINVASLAARVSLPEWYVEKLLIQLTGVVIVNESPEGTVYRYQENNPAEGLSEEGSGEEWFGNVSQNQPVGRYQPGDDEDPRWGDE